MKWLYAFLVAVAVPGFSTPLWADDDDERATVRAEDVTESDGDVTRDTLTLASVESSRTSPSNTQASIQRVPFQLLDDLEDETPVDTSRPPVGWGAIPLPPIDEDYRPQDSRLRPQDIAFDEEEARKRVLIERSTVGDGFFHTDLIAESRPPRNPHMEVFQRLATKVAFRHIRRLFRSELKDRFEDDPSFDYYDYIEQRREIGRLGRPDMTSDAVGIEEILESARSEAHNEDEDVYESDIPLIDWGPLQLSDRGQLKLGFNRLASENTSGRVKLVDDTQEELPPPRSCSGLFGLDTWRIDTDLKFRPDVREIARVSDGANGYRKLLGKVKANLEIDFYTAMLQRKYMSTEFEVSIDEDNRAAFFVNLVIYGR